MSYQPRSRDQHYLDTGPKRILTIDGGGLRGMFSLELLKEIETILRNRHGDEFRLCHYFDLMAGTSTGSIIAAALALGMSVDEVTNKYNELGSKVFKKSFFRKGAVRAKYDKDELIAALKDTCGVNTLMGSEEIQTGLLIMTKRRDTGSPWPISNNPKGKYFPGNEQNTYIPNKDYPLWSVVRASTAAPAFFKSESIEISRQKGMPTVKGDFVDGGVSPFNNPALQAFMFATLDGFRVNWKTGANQMLLVSLGTGSRDPGVEKPSFSIRSPFKSLAAKTEASQALASLVGMMDDCNALVQTMMQWMSSGPSAMEIDGEIEDLSNDLISPEPLFTYLRYNIELSKEGVEALDANLNFDDKTYERLEKMDVPDNLPILAEIGKAAADKLIKEQHFPAGFDLTNQGAPTPQTG